MNIWMFISIFRVWCVYKKMIIKIDQKLDLLYTCDLIEVLDLILLRFYTKRFFFQIVYALMLYAQILYIYPIKLYVSCVWYNYIHTQINIRRRRETLEKLQFLYDNIFWVLWGNLCARSLDLTIKSYYRNWNV